MRIMSLLPFGKNVKWRIKKDKKINEEQRQAVECLSLLMGPHTDTEVRWRLQEQQSKILARQQDHGPYREK